ncbi:hypothetical protein ACJRO7_003529 [Eucalyptus globulus]|uniref:Aluminum-activated malate transporter n=1 Tax=Eucalyptus globulus TaxID=34317 RepID=A0ABD3IYH6_EUCGL
MNISVEFGKCLKEIASDIRKMSRPSMSASIHLASTKAASKELQLLLESSWWEGVDLLEMTLTTVVILLLIDIAEYLLKISETADKLASLAHFKCMELGALPSVVTRVSTYDSPMNHPATSL